MPHMRFYIDNDLTSDQIEVSGDEARHINKVMRADVSDVIELINGRGSLAIGHIVEVEKKKLRVALEQVSVEPPPKYRLTLFQALPKMPHLNLIVEKCCELGIDEIVLFESSHSEKKGVSNQQIERLNHVSIAACKQCGRLYQPLIRLGHLKEAQGKIFFGDFTISPLSQEKIESDITFVNGPERGFSNEDLKILESLNATGISLSTNVLRTETAAICATALLRLYNLT